MLEVVLGIIIIWMLSSILQELRSIRRLLIGSNNQLRESRGSSSVEEEKWTETNDICPSCGNELDPESDICSVCELEFKED